MKSYTLLENILLDIEEGIKNNITASILSKKHNLSSIHLQRLFKFSFKQSLGAYIRSRTLSESLNDVLHTDKKIVDIALEYGFSFDNSYSRSFKREFGISPHKLRKSWQTVKIQPPLHLFCERRNIRQYDRKHCKMEKFLNFCFTLTQ